MGRWRGTSRELTAPLLALGVIAGAPGALRAAPSTSVLLPSANAKSEAQAAPPAPAPSPAPVPFPRLARTLEDDLARIAHLERSTLTSRASATVAGELPRMTERIAEAEAALAGMRPDELSFREIDQARLDWMQRGATLEVWQTSLESDAGQIDDARREIEGRLATWRATLDGATRDGLPEPLVARIELLVARAEALLKSLRARAGAVLLVQDSLATDRGRVEAALERLASLSADVSESLFAVENDPLWTAVRAARPNFTLAAQVAESWHASASMFRRIIGRHPIRFALQIAAFLALAIAGSRLGRRARNDPRADAGAREAAGVLERPVSAAAAVALFLTFWIYPLNAVPVHAAALTLLLLPYFRFVPRLMRPALHRPLYALGAVFALDRVHEFALAHSLVQRLALFAIGWLGLVSWAWTLRAGKASREGSPSVWVAAARFGGAAAMAFLAVAIVANAVGNVSLAVELTVIAVKGAYVAVVLFIVVRTLESLLALSLRALAARGVRVVRNHTALLERRGRFVLRAAALTTWVTFVLIAMRITDVSGEFVLAALRKRWVFGHIDIALGQVVAFGVALASGLLVARLLRFLLDEAVFPRTRLPRGVPAAISATVGYVAVTAGLVMAFLAAGLEMSQFTFLAGAFGVGIGFGLQNVVNNFVSGLILLYERPIQVGDVLELGALRGRVRRIGIRSSTLATYDGAEVIVPNATLISSNVVNWTLSDRLRRVDVAIGISYGSDPRRALELLTRVARDHAEVLADPEPAAVFVGFGESSLDLELRCWASDYEAFVRIGSELRTAIFGAFREAGIEIPFPQREVHVRTGASGANKSGSIG